MFCGFIRFKGHWPWIKGHCLLDFLCQNSKILFEIQEWLFEIREQLFWNWGTVIWNLGILIWNSWMSKFEIYLIAGHLKSTNSFLKWWNEYLKWGHGHLKFGNGYLKSANGYLKSRNINLKKSNSSVLFLDFKLNIDNFKPFSNFKNFEFWLRKKAKSWNLKTLGVKDLYLDIRSSIRKWIFLCLWIVFL